MVNDSRNDANAKMCEMGIDTPALCLFATRDISRNTEIRYNYGGNNLIWRDVSVNECVAFLKPKSMEK